METKHELDWEKFLAWCEKKRYLLGKNQLMAIEMLKEGRIPRWPLGAGKTWLEDRIAEFIKEIGG